MADLDNGYLRLVNQIQDALCVVELKAFCVPNAIVRLTYGWSKKEDRIANSLIADKPCWRLRRFSGSQPLLSQHHQRSQDWQITDTSGSTPVWM